MSRDKQSAGLFAGWTQDWYPTGCRMRSMENIKGVLALSALNLVIMLTALFSRHYWLLVPGFGLMLLPLLTMVALRLRRPEEVLGWYLLSSGLHEHRRNGQRRAHPWATIREVTETPDGLIVTTDDGELRYNGPRDQAALATAIRERVTRQGGERRLLPPEQIAAWLGIRLDESIRVRRPGWSRFVVPTILLALLLGTAVLTSNLGQGANWLLLFVLLTQLPIAFLVSRGDCVTVSPYGLEGRRKRLAWDEVEMAARVAGTWTVTGSDGALTLEGPQAKRVIDVVNQVLEAKEAGAVLPRMGAVPAGAISRAKGVEVNAERGISAAEDRP